MALTDYTSYAEIRAVLGVSDEEVTDTTLGLQLYADQLGLHLDDISSTLASDFVDVSALLTPTATQQKFLKVCRLFSTYAVSKDLLASLPLFAPRRITDGKAEVERYVDVFEDVKDGVLSGYITMRKRLEDAYLALEPTFTPSVAVSLVFSVSTGLATDPVTG
jgi:hypothetical protein